MTQLTCTGAGRSAAAGYTFPLLTLFGEVERLAASGDYSLTCGTGAEALPVEFVNNAAGNVTISADTNWGNATADQRLLAVRVRGNLTIDAAKTLTTAARKLGLLIFCDGDVTVNGTLSMTARGANHSATGSNLTAFDTMLYEVSAAANNILPAAGGAGGGDTAGDGAGSTGTAGTNGQPGGGGSGARIGAVPRLLGAAGTAFTGGAGGGAAHWSLLATAGATSGGSGGIGGTSDFNLAGGGAGNPGGNGGLSGAGNNAATAGGTGTGGVLIIVAFGTISISATGVVQSNGMPGNTASALVGGGGSGGGSISFYYAGAYNNAGTIQANGGATGIGTSYTGGAGGAGSIRAVAL